MNILLLASHAVAEYDDLRMFTDLGYDCFAPGGYEVPGQEGEGIRPPLPDAPHHPDLVARLQEVRAARGEPGTMIDWGKAALHDDIIDWADVIIVHHFVDRWIGLQWDRIKHKRVIWRTCGQSNAALEDFMSQFAGLQVVRYSPAERRHFERLGSFAGEDALIRFGKYPDDYGPWIGDNYGKHGGDVANVTQDMAKRGDACGLGFWLAATEGLPTRPAGPGSEELRGGVGSMPYPAMLEYLRRSRAYLYTGTRPASYTLGLIEAMLSGVPVVSIGSRAWGAEWGGEDLFEVDGLSHENRLEPAILAKDRCFDDPAQAKAALRTILDYPDKAANISRGQRSRAIELFGIDTIGAQWKAFLS